MNQELTYILMELSQKRARTGSLNNHRQGATYVSLSDTIILHLAHSYDDGDAELIEAINRDNETVHCRQSRSQTINIIQMEDTNCYGYQFCCIPPLSPPGKADMMD